MTIVPAAVTTAAGVVGFLPRCGCRSAHAREGSSRRSESPVRVLSTRYSVPTMITVHIGQRNLVHSFMCLDAVFRLTFPRQDVPRRRGGSWSDGDIPISDHSPDQDEANGQQAGCLSANSRIHHVGIRLPLAVRNIPPPSTPREGLKPPPRNRGEDNVTVHLCAVRGKENAEPVNCTVPWLGR